MKKVIVSGFTFFMALAIAASVASIIFSGDYTSNLGDMTIKENSGISGSVTGVNARTFEGPTNRNIAKLTWKGSDGKTRRAVMNFAADGKSFKGSWGYQSSYTDGGE